MEEETSVPLLKLTNKKILPIFLESLKDLYKQQENKKKNYKKLIGYFSIRVGKYDDNPIIDNTSLELQMKKSEMINIYNHRKKKATNTNNNNFNTKNQLTEHSYNSDSSIYTKETLFQPSQENHQRNNRTNHYSMTKFHQNEKMKFLKHRFNKQIDQKNSKRFLMENESLINFDYSNLNNSNKSPSNDQYNKKALDFIVLKNLEKNKELIFFDDDKFNGDYDNDENDIENSNKCFYSLDQKAKIIYIKPSQKNISLFNSNIMSKKATKNNVSNADSLIYNESSQCKGEGKEEGENEENGEINLNHEIIVEKLNDIKIMRKSNNSFQDQEDKSNTSNDDDEIE